MAGRSPHLSPRRTAANRELAPILLPGFRDSCRGAYVVSGHGALPSNFYSHPTFPMTPTRVPAVIFFCVALSACIHVRASAGHDDVAAASPTLGTVAHVYYWRAKPGKLAEYTRYVRDSAEPIDYEAKRAGAFISVTTYVSTDTASLWTHMRIFILRDSAQLNALGDALSSAGVRLEPDSVKRRLRGEYSASLRDRVGDQVVSLLPPRQASP